MDKISKYIKIKYLNWKKKIYKLLQLNNKKIHKKIKIKTYKTKMSNYNNNKNMNNNCKL